LINAAKMEAPNKKQEVDTNYSQHETKAVHHDDHLSTAELTIANTEHEHDNFSLDLHIHHVDSLENNDGNVGRMSSVVSNIWHAIKRTFSSPPLLTMIFAFAVGCIPFLRNSLFAEGGALRFIGAALETLGQAASSLLTMIVAASLVPPKEQEDEEHADLTAAEVTLTGQPPVAKSGDDIAIDDMESNKTRTTNCPDVSIVDARTTSIRRFGESFRRSSIQAWNNARQTPPEQRRLFLWFALGRLVLTPALVVLAIAGLDCSGFLNGVPKLALLVLVVNAAVPGALIIVVVLKSAPELHETAAVVAKMYGPTYILSIATISAWTALGLLISTPAENGNSFCSRF
jgi:hypothetical protein